MADDTDAQNVPLVTQKRCTVCLVIRPIAAFAVDRGFKDGRKARCRLCRKAYYEANKARVAAKGAAWCAANKVRKAKSGSDWYKDNREHYLAKKAVWRQENRTSRLAKAAEWRINNPERFRSSVKIWRKNNIERCIAKQLAWNAANPEKLAAISARYRAAKLRAVPSWANLIAIEAIYEKAISLTRQTGIPYHVDHIVPLQSKIVCGLHCEDNLQVIPGIENIIKGNRRWPGMPNMM